MSAGDGEEDAMTGERRGPYPRLEWTHFSYACEINLHALCSGRAYDYGACLCKCHAGETASHEYKPILPADAFDSGERGGAGGSGGGVQEEGG